MTSSASSDLSRVLREAIECGLDHRDEALEYALQFGRGIDAAVADRFVAMYVNDLTQDYGDEGRSAVAELLRRGDAIGAFPGPVTVDWVGLTVYSENGSTAASDSRRSDDRDRREDDRRAEHDPPRERARPGTARRVAIATTGLTYAYVDDRPERGVVEQPDVGREPDERADQRRGRRTRGATSPRWRRGRVAARCRSGAGSARPRASRTSSPRRRRAGAGSARRGTSPSPRRAQTCP